VVLSSHDLNGMEMLCDEVSFMKRGRIQIHSDMDDVIEGVQKWQGELAGEDMEKLKKEIPLFDIQQMGRVVTFQTMGNAAENEEKLVKLGVEALARQKITFEEVFLTWDENVELLQKQKKEEGLA